MAGALQLAVTSESPGGLAETQRAGPALPSGF